MSSNAAFPENEAEANELAALYALNMLAIEKRDRVRQRAV